MECAGSTWLCELLSSCHPTLNLFTWNPKRGWITLFEGNASHLLTVHQNNSSVKEHVTAGCMLCFSALLGQTVKSLWAG